jgi:hypothetical protein
MTFWLLGGFHETLIEFVIGRAENKKWRGKINVHVLIILNLLMNLSRNRPTLTSSIFILFFKIFTSQ